MKEMCFRLHERLHAMIADYSVKSIMSPEEYEKAAQEYYQSLPLEHFMEATTQNMQCQITEASFALLRRRRGDIRYFGELLVQYFYRGNLCSVVPDNMLVIGELEDRKRTSFPVELEPYPPFLTVEYVSESNRRKDYVENMRRYDHELHVPYYLLFEPDRQELRLYRSEGGRYVLVKVNAAGRLPIIELDLEVGLLDGWVRYWHQGELLEIPTELADRIGRMEQRLDAQADELDLKDRQLQQKDQQLEQKDQQLEQKDQQLEFIVANLRPVVRLKAQNAGRSDILQQLDSVADGAQLTRWLAELP
jgi:Uma2 family endonuclease